MEKPKIVTKMEKKTIPQEFFDMLAYDGELNNYKKLAKALTEAYECFRKLEFGKLTPELMKQFYEGNYDEFGISFSDSANKQVKDIKNPLLKRSVLTMANDEFAMFKQKASRIISSHSFTRHPDIDFSLFDVSETEVVVSDKQVEFLKDKHTIKPHTDKQNEYVDLCQKVASAVEELEIFLRQYERFTVIGSAFDLEIDINIQGAHKINFNPASIEYVK